MTDAPLIALVTGSDAHKGQDWSPQVEIANTGSTDVYRLGAFDDDNRRVLHVSKGYYRQKRRYTFADYDLILNLVTDADQNKAVLQTLAKALNGCTTPVLNRPEAVVGTTRQAAAKTLAGIANLVVPRVRTVKSLSPNVVGALLRADAIAFPAIIRRAGTHGGDVLGVAKDAAALAGLKRSDSGYTLTEFVDFKSRDGLYRKFRVFVFGGRPVFRHLLISDRWNVHMSDRARFMMARADLIEASQSLYERGMASFPAQIHTVLTTIAERLGLDVFGVDFGLLPDGRMVLFEANATMNFFPISDDPALAAMKLCVPPARAAFQAMVNDALAKP